MARLTVKRIAGALGAEIGDVDLRSLTDREVSEIRKAWLEHLVVFFRDQPITWTSRSASASRLNIRL